jgi:hypothetical protein
MTWWSRSICTVDSLLNCSCLFIPFSNPALAIGFIALSGLSVLLALYLLSRIRFPYKVKVKEKKEIPNELINYTFPYVVSFMGVNYSEPDRLLGFLAFFLWMFAITYKSGQILVNPLLLVFDWKLYESKIEINRTVRSVRILAKGVLEDGEVSAQAVQDLYVVKKLFHG